MISAARRRFAGVRGSHYLKIIFTLSALLAFHVAPGRAASPKAPPEPTIRATRLIVQPAALELRGADDEQGLLVTAVASDGRQMDVTDKARFTSKQPKQATISAGGACRPVSDGQTEIIASYNGVSARVSVTAIDSALTRPPSFQQDIEPVLTRGGCNAGGCHGKLAGQNGFKLSLRGYAPEWDHDWVMSDLKSRRINPAAPNESLLVLKAVAAVPHEGGQRFAEGSRAHRTLLAWIAARAPGPVADEPDATRLEVLPGNRTMRLGERQQLLVRAHYADGRVRDVTWLSKFFSNDETVIKVTPEGRVRPLRAGETAVRVHFQGQVAVVMFTMPHETKVDPQLFVRRNNAVDEAVFEKLKTLRLPPSADCDDATFLRRAFLDTTGTPPAPEEVRAFLADQRGDKRARLVNELLERPEFVDYWTLQFSDLLQNRKERDHDVRGAKGVRSFHAWLRAQVAANRPWNELARDILTASGDSVARPQIGYYIVNVGEKSRAEESEIADGVAQSFLGTRIGCARCHNHPLEKYTQDDFYHFAAFFSRVTMKREEMAKGPTSLLTRTREEEEQQKSIDQLVQSLAEAEAAAGAQPGAENSKKAAEVKKKLAEARAQLEQLQIRQLGASQPRTKKFLPPQPLDRSNLGVKPGEDPRVRLAAWMTDPKNEYFSGAMVNRLWRHFMSVGLVEPVDDLRASNPPTNPELWQTLNREFIAHGYDLKHVMRLILNSRAYQLSSATLPGNETDRHFYSHYYARRLPAEVLLDAISQATSVPDQFSGYPVGTRAIQLPEPGVSSYFLSLFGRSDRVTACACERNGEVTLPQLLHLQNGEDAVKKIRATEGRLTALLKDSADDPRTVEELFLTALGRRPSAAETEAVTKALAAGDDRKEVYADLFWALLNSKEFAFNH